MTDGHWIIFLGTTGIVGLTAFGTMMLLPVVRYAWLMPATAWTGPSYAGPSGCAVVVGLWCVDSLFNAMPMPLLVVMAGGLARLKLNDQSAGRVR